MRSQTFSNRLQSFRNRCDFDSAAKMAIILSSNFKNRVPILNIFQNKKISQEETSESGNGKVVYLAMERWAGVSCLHQWWRMQIGHQEIHRGIIGQLIFWQFIGIGYSNFDVLRRLDTMDGRVVDNANFSHLDDISQVSDEELYDQLLNEFPMWLKEAKEKRILK